MNRKITLLYFFLFFTPLFSLAQSFPIPYDYNFYNRITDTLYSTHQRIHTSIKPFGLIDSAVQAALDTVQAKTFNPKKSNFLIRKIFNQHLVQYYKSEYAFYFDFFPDFQVGKEIKASSTWLNTRGFQLGGKIGSQVFFQTSFYENQGKFPSYITNFINTSQVVPGQGYVRPYGKGGFDFSSADGYVSFTPSKFFTFQLGHGKNFIGDGYRSLLLSDNAFNYPYFKAITTVGPFKYMNIWSQMQYTNGIPFTDSTAYPKKYAIFQYLDWSIDNHFNVGLFENTMLRPRGFDFNFVNPIIFLRPVEYSVGNPDKSLIGVTGSYKFLDRYMVYTQIVINEFTTSKVFGDPGYWANKQGFQLGGRAFNLLKVKKLNLLLEYNTIRPFTYTALNNLISYSHYGQPLGDPLGTNFREFVSIANYTYKRLDLRAQFNYALEGQDDPSKPSESTGGDIFKPYTYRTANEGYFIGSGIRTNLYFVDLRAAYILNYKNNLRIEVGYTGRNQINSLGTQRSNYFTLGLRASFRNVYYDF